MPRQFAFFLLLILSAALVIGFCDETQAKPRNQVSQSDKTQETKSPTQEQAKSESDTHLPNTENPQQDINPESPQPQEPAKELISYGELIEKVEELIRKNFTEFLDKKRQDAPWQERWNEARARVIKMQKRAQDYATAFASKRALLLSLGDYERQFAQILPSLNTYKNWASPMEAINSRLSLMVAQMEEEYAPLREIYEQEQKLLTSVMERLSYKNRIPQQKQTPGAQMNRTSKIGQ